eukprot:1574636-Alexandrium_andersonii.AAC.1
MSAELFASRAPTATSETSTRPSVQLPEDRSSSSAGDFPQPKTPPKPKHLPQAKYAPRGCNIFE